MIVAWVALGLGLANLVVWAAVVVAARRLWVRMAPAVAPLMVMFAPAPQPGTASTASGVIESSDD